MKLEIIPTEKPEKLAENLEKRVEQVKVSEGILEAEAESYGFLDRVPGVKSYTAEEEHEGIGGSPVDQKAYARIESEKDAVRCLLATVEGIDVTVLNTDREWDLRKLRRFNPDIKHVKSDEPVPDLGIDAALFETEDLEHIDVEMPEKEQVLKIYREMLT